MVACRKCGMYFVNLEDLTHHNFTTHISKFTMNTDEGNSVTLLKNYRGVFKCQVCFNSCNSLKEISHHLFCEFDSIKPDFINNKIEFISESIDGNFHLDQVESQEDFNFILTALNTGNEQNESVETNEFNCESTRKFKKHILI